MIRHNPDGSVTVGIIPAEPKPKEPAPVKRGGRTTKKK